ncbi:MAG: hypothetical protein V3S49_03315 [Thermodesulfobacteriota bacterium]
MSRLIWMLIIIFVGSFSWATDSFSYPGGPPVQVANGGPYCASCHSSLQANTVRELPEKKIDEILAKNRHYMAIEKGLKKYESLSPEVRKELVKDVMAIDNNTSIKLEAPDIVGAGETFKVTVKTRGGGGPVIGVMLLDSDLRYQSSPPQTVGWSIVSPPEVIGPDGKKQTKWIDKRHNDVTKNINFVVVYGVESDPRKGSYPEVEVTYMLKAPALEGKLPLSAAILYGTETASPVGFKEEIWGKVPVGGFTAASGRIVFTEMKRITVR